VASGSYSKASEPVRDAPEPTLYRKGLR